jgi:hypothetical protein
MTPSDPKPSALLGLGDDQLGTMAISLAVGELQWTPDVAPAVMDRIARDAVTYPEQFDRRPQTPERARAAAPEQPSVGRTVTRIVVIAVVIMLVAGLVVVATTADASIAAMTAAVVLSPLVEVS